VARVSRETRWRRGVSPLARALTLALTLSTPTLAAPPDAAPGSGDASTPALRPTPYEAARLCLIRINQNDFSICRGPYREEVTAYDFYVLVGRQDLADKDSHRRLALGLTVGGGLAAALLGLVSLVAPIVPGSDEKAPWPVTVGLIGGGLTIGWIGSAAFGGPTVTPNEAAGLVNLYNARLPGAPPERRLREARILGVSGTF
jgi:hypothetical protein